MLLLQHACKVTWSGPMCADSSITCAPLQLAYGEAQALDRVMYEEEVRREALSFEQQFHYGAGPVCQADVTIKQNGGLSCKSPAQLRSRCVFNGGGSSAL